MRSVHFKIMILILVLSSTAALVCGCNNLLISPLYVTNASLENSTVTVEFSAVPELNSLIQNFSFSKDGEKLSGDFFIENTSVLFKPYVTIEQNYTYELKILKATETVSGLSLEEDYIKTFNYKEENAPLKIISVFPPDDYTSETSVSFIEYVFTNPVSEKSFDGAFSITPSVKYRTFWNEDKNQVLIEFDSELSLSTRYTCKVSTSLYDKSHNYLQSDYYSSFTNCSDTTPPDYSVYIKNSEGSETEVENGSNCTLGRSDTLLIKYTEPVENEKLSSVCSVKPGYSLEYSHDERNRLYSEISFSQESSWGLEYDFLIAEGLCDLSGNECKKEFYCKLCFSKITEKPPVFAGGYFTTDSENEETFFSFTPKDTYSRIVFDSVLFPPDTGSQAKLYLLFEVNEHAAALNYLSALRSISLSATGECLTVYLTSIKIHAAQDGICKAECLLDIKNNGTQGFIVLNVTDDLCDTLGNKIEKPVEMIFSKL